VINSTKISALNMSFMMVGLWCLIPLSTIFQLYRGGQFYWWRKPEYPEKTTDLSHVTDVIYQQLRYSYEKSILTKQINDIIYLSAIWIFFLSSHQVILLLSMNWIWYNYMYWILTISVSMNVKLIMTISLKTIGLDAHYHSYAMNMTW